MHVSSVEAPWSDEWHLESDRRPPKPKQTGSETKKTVSPTREYQPPSRDQQHAVQWKIKILSLLFKVQREGWLKVLSEKALPFSEASFSQLVMVFFTCYLTVILRKTKKFK